MNSIKVLHAEGSVSIPYQFEALVPEWSEEVDWREGFGVS